MSHFGLFLALRNGFRREVKIVKESKFKAEGKHLLLNLSGCKSELLNDEQRILKILEEASRLVGSTKLGSISHKFKPQGVSAVLLLKESHISIHSYPEEGKAFLDVFTCGKKPNPLKAVDYIVESFKATRKTTKFVKRK